MNEYSFIDTRRIFTIPKHEDFCHPMSTRNAGSHRRTWWCSQRPSGGHIPEQPRQNECPTSSKANQFKLLEESLKNTYANNLLVGHTSYEQMLLFFLRIELDAIWYFFVGKPRNHLSSFSVPQFDVAIVGCWQKSGPWIVEANVTNGLSVTVIRTNASSIFVNFPDLKTVFKNN